LHASQRHADAMWRTDLLLPAAVNVLSGLRLLDPGAAAQPAMGVGYRWPPS